MKNKNSKTQKNEVAILPSSSDEGILVNLLGDIRSFIEASKVRVAKVLINELALLYWRIGRRIEDEVIKNNRAEYGKKIVENLSKRLTEEYGKGFSSKSLFHMIRFAQIFIEEEKVSTLSRQLSWSHFIEIIYLKEPLQRDFYIEMCCLERWSVRTLRNKIRGMLYERTAISKKPDILIRQELQELRNENRMTPDLVFRDPYLLDFLGLADTYRESDLEQAILYKMETFLLELGTDFTFVSRQKRLTIGEEDFYLDLLFYHRGLRRLVAIELKLGKFSATHKGQMELYLRWLDKYERRSGEEAPIGLILCSEKDEEQIELLRLDQGEIRVSEYLTELPSRPVLKAKLNEAIRIARERFDENNKVN